MSVPGPNLDIEVADRYDTDEPLLEPEGIARLIVAEGQGDQPLSFRPVRRQKGTT